MSYESAARRIALLALPLVSLSAFADDEKSLLDSVRLGETWYGPKVTTEDLKGRVVLLDFWGIN